MKIKYVDWGVANRYDDCIEINENIKKYPCLHAAIIEHELGHTSEKGFTWFDFKHDLFQRYPADKWRFIWDNKRAFLQQNFPISKRNGYWVIDINLLILYSISVLGGLACYYYLLA